MIKKIKLILDAAHMSGTLYNSKNMLALKDISVFVCGCKNLPSADAGIINFKDKKLLNLAKSSVGVE